MLQDDNRIEQLDEVGWFCYYHYNCCLESTLQLVFRSSNDNSRVCWFIVMLQEKKINKVNSHTLSDHYKQLDEVESSNHSLQNSCPADV